MHSEKQDSELRARMRIEIQDSNAGSAALPRASKLPDVELLPRQARLPEQT